MTLTQEERTALISAVSARYGWDSFAHHMSATEIAQLTEIALEAVPKLAQASPMVKALVAMVQSNADILEQTCGAPRCSRDQPCAHAQGILARLHELTNKDTTDA